MKLRPGNIDRISDAWLICSWPTLMPRVMNSLPLGSMIWPSATWNWPVAAPLTLATQPAVSAPAAPWHCQIQDEPSCITGVAVPELQRLVVGAVLKLWPPAEPHSPLPVVEPELQPLELPAVVPELLLVPVVEPELDAVEPDEPLPELTPELEDGL